jgi:hypothetical protein
MLAPLAAVLAKLGQPKTAEAGAQRESLKRWFWCAVFGQAYENAPNSQSAKDVTELFTWLGGGSLPESVSAVRFDPKALRDVTPRQRSIYRGTICLILGHGTGARDFHTQAVSPCPIAEPVPPSVRSSYLIRGCCLHPRVAL